MDLTFTRRHCIKGEITRIMKTILCYSCILVLLVILMCSILLFRTSTLILGWSPTDYLLTSRLDMLGNPITALLIGIVSTAIIQQPAVVLGILITLVQSNNIHPLVAIPVLMGINIGSHFTPTLVAMTLFYKRVRFQNGITSVLLPHLVGWFTTVILLPLEFATGFMLELSKLIIKDGLPVISSSYQQYGLLQGALKPLTSLLLKVDMVDKNNTITNSSLPLTVQCSGILTNSFIRCEVSGVLLFVLGSIVSIVCILAVCKLVAQQDKYQDCLRLVSVVNPKDYCSYLKGCMLIVLGCLLAIWVQDSVLVICVMLPITATRRVVPDNVYSVILGANVGAAISILLVALSDSSTSTTSLQLIFCYFIFNMCSVVLFYIIPYSSRIPIQFAEIISQKTSDHRWFIIVLASVGYFGLPLLTYGLSLAGHYYVISFVSVIVFIMLILSSVSFMQVYCPNCLPQCMQSWQFLPSIFRSLEPYESFAVSVVHVLDPRSCTRSQPGPNQSSIQDSPVRRGDPTDIYVSVSEDPINCCCCSWVKPSRFYTKYSLNAPTQTSTPKVLPNPTKTPVLINYSKPESAQDDSELIESICKYDPREALNFGTLGFEDDLYSSSSDSEDPSDFTQTTCTTSSSSSSAYSYASISGDNLQLLHHAF